jgi:hypothetical protein
LQRSHDIGPSRPDRRRMITRRVPPTIRILDVAMPKALEGESAIDATKKNGQDLRQLPL